ncbi:MAG: glycosyltransferase family 4 protein, partial [Pseudomonadota bacterium]
MKLLFMTSDKYPVFRPAAKFIFGRELPGRGVKIDWLIQSDGDEDAPKRVHLDNGTIYLASSNRRESKIAKVFKHFLDIVNDLRVFQLAFANRYDVIQVKDKYLGAILGALAAFFTKSKFAYWIAYPHAEESLYTAREGFAKFKYFSYIRGYVYAFCLYKIVCPMADTVFVQSEQMKEDMAQRGVDRDKMVPVPGSVDIVEIQAFLNGKQPTVNHNQILYVGTLMRLRHLEMLVEALALVRETVPDATLHFLGKGEHPADEELLKGAADRLGLTDSVVFLGNQPYEFVIKYVAASAVCLSPYYPSFVLNSTSPTKLLEYMAVGRPIVGNVHPEQKQVIADSDCGECVEWSAEAFAAAIVKLLQDTQTAEQRGAKGKAYIEENRTHKILSERVLNT